MIIAGIDYSMTSPSICIFVGEERDAFCFNKCTFHFLTDTDKYATYFLKNIYGTRFDQWSDDTQRFKTIADWAVEKVRVCDSVALEGYSYGSKSGLMFNIAENTGILKYKLYDCGIPVEIMPPTTVKKYATGKGNSDKNAMHRSFRLETGVDLKEEITPRKAKVGNPVSDIVDSYYICKLLHEKIIDSHISS